MAGLGTSGDVPELERGLRVSSSHLMLAFRLLPLGRGERARMALTVGGRDMGRAGGPESRGSFAAELIRWAAVARGLETSLPGDRPAMRTVARTIRLGMTP